MDGSETGRLSQAPCCFWFHVEPPGVASAAAGRADHPCFNRLGSRLDRWASGLVFAEPLTPALKAFLRLCGLDRFDRRTSAGSAASGITGAAIAAFAATSPTPWGTQLARSGRRDVQRTVPAEPRRDPVPAPPVDRQILPTALPRTTTPFALLTITPQGRGAQDGLVAEANIAVYVGSSAMQTGD